MSPSSSYKEPLSKPMAILVHLPLEDYCSLDLSMTLFPAYLLWSEPCRIFLLSVALQTLLRGWVLNERFLLCVNCFSTSQWIQDFFLWIQDFEYFFLQIHCLLCLERAHFPHLSRLTFCTLIEAKTVWGPWETPSQKRWPRHLGRESWQTNEIEGCRMLFQLCYLPSLFRLHRARE